MNEKEILDGILEGKKKCIDLMATDPFLGAVLGRSFEMMESIQLNSLEKKESLNLFDPVLNNSCQLAKTCDDKSSDPLRMSLYALIEGFGRTMTEITSQHVSSTSASLHPQPSSSPHPIQNSSLPSSLLLPSSNQSTIPLNKDLSHSFKNLSLAGTDDTNNGDPPLSQGAPSSVEKETTPVKTRGTTSKDEKGFACNQCETVLSSQRLLNRHHDRHREKAARVKREAKSGEEKKKKKIWSTPGERLVNASVPNKDVSQYSELLAHVTHLRKLLEPDRRMEMGEGGSDETEKIKRDDEERDKIIKEE